jgi:hypothetical protein
MPTLAFAVLPHHRAGPTAEQPVTLNILKLSELLGFLMTFCSFHNATALDLPMRIISQKVMVDANLVMASSNNKLAVILIR